MKPFRCVWALQSPTLLNMLRSPEWDMRVVDLGDSLFAERHHLLDPVSDPLEVDPEIVFVCTPEHVKRALQTWPTAKLMWVTHQGYRHRLPHEVKACAGIVTFHRQLASYHLESPAGPNLPVHVLTPHFEVSSCEVGSILHPYVIMSRPKTRPRMVVGAIEDLRDAVLRRLGIKVWWYGEDAPDGYSPDRQELYRTHGCMFSRLPWLSGLGLAEHEAMAAGMPSVFSTWCCFDPVAPYAPAIAFSDVDRLVNDYETLLANPVEVAERVSTNKLYIQSQYSEERRDRSIKRFIEFVRQ